MNEKSGYQETGLAVDAKNREDYDQLTGRIEAALETIRNERDETGEYAHEPSPEVLAKLAKPCSVATLYNRKNPVNPILELKKIKEARIREAQENIQKGEKKETLRITRDHAKSVDVLVREKQQLEKERNDALDQQCIWSKKYTDLEAVVRELQRVNDGLSKIVDELEMETVTLRKNNAALEAEATRLKDELNNVRTPGKVIGINARKQSDLGDANA